MRRASGLTAVTYGQILCNSAGNCQFAPADLCDHLLLAAGWECWSDIYPALTIAGARRSRREAGRRVLRLLPRSSRTPHSGQRTAHLCFACGILAFWGMGLGAIGGKVNLWGPEVRARGSDPRLLCLLTLFTALVYSFHKTLLVFASPHSYNESRHHLPVSYQDQRPDKG